MALGFITGSAGAGKTRTLLEEMIRQSAQEPERRFFVVVPEQFTMQTQQTLVRLAPEKCILNLEVTSLNRLAYRVFAETGRGGADLMEEIGKSFLIGKIALEKRKEMVFFGDQLTRPENIAEMKALISELMVYGVDPGMLREAAEGSSKLKLKLRDIHTVYAAFRERLAGSAMTSEEVPERFAAVAADSAMIRGSVMAFDGFTGFTPVQLRLIRAFLPLVRDLYVTVTYDSDRSAVASCGRTDLFTLSIETIRLLTREAREAGVPLLERRVVRRPENAPDPKEPSLAFLERHLFRKEERVFGETPEGISARKCANPREEMEEAARKICRLVREQGYRYRDFAVVTGDLSAYGPCAEEIFSAHGIPFFIDEKRKLTGNPFIEYLRAACEVCLEDWSYESVFRLLKTGMTDFGQDETDRLEHYVLGCGIRGRKKWYGEFTAAYRNEDPAEVPALNGLRERVCGLIGPLSETFSSRMSTVREKSAALYEFCVRSRAKEKLDEYIGVFEKKNRPDLVREYAQVYPYVCGFLDKLVAMLGDERISMRDYAALLDAGFAEARIAIIPPGSDRVFVGDVERSRVPEVKVLIFPGMNEGLVPKPVSVGGFLTEPDRAALAGMNVKLKPTSREAVVTGRFYLYTALAKPTRRLFVSWCTNLADGSEAHASYLIDVLKRMFPLLEEERAEEDALSLIERPTHGIAYLADRIRGIGAPGPDDAFLQVFSLFRGDPDYAGQTAMLLRAAGTRRKQDEIGRAAAKALYGEVLRNSATRLERFCECRFRHFLDFGLRLQERPAYEFTGSDFGTLIHRSLEIYGEKLIGRGDAGEEEHLRLVNEALDQAAEETGRDSVLYSTPRSRYELSRMRRMLERTVRTLKEQADAGDFRISGAEDPFSSSLDLHSLCYDLPGGARMILTGRIDRIDTSTDGDVVYVRVTDYKTGSVTFDPKRIYYGLQLQLAIYMNAAAEMIRRKGGRPCPAGMYYMKVWDPVLEYREGETPEAFEERRTGAMRPSGVALGDPEVLRRYDRELPLKGESSVINVRMGRNGSLKGDVLDESGFLTIGRYAGRKAEETGALIMSGRAEVNPYRLGQENACTYCPYRTVCGFDEKIPGCSWRNLRALNGSEAVALMQEDLDGMDR